MFANSQSINISYKTVGGNGIVSGKTNGVWHYFAKGHTVTLKVTSKSGAGTSYANLKRSVSLWLDSDYGDVNTKIGSHSFSKKTDVTSGSYYLIFHGGTVNHFMFIKHWWELLKPPSNTHAFTNNSLQD